MRLMQPLQIDDLLLNRYRLLKRVSRTSPAAVFLAEDQRDGSHVAIKYVTSQGNAADLLEREYQILSQLRHIANIVSVHSFERDGAGAFIVMEWVDGVDGKHVIQGPAITFDTWLWIAQTLVTTLHHCHGLDILHMDIKPQNLLLGNDRTPICLAIRWLP